MWKDYFHYTKKERIGVLVFFLVIAVVFSLKFFMPRQMPEEHPEQEEFPVATSSEYGQRPQTYSSGSSSRKNTRSYKETYVLHDFDPNTADSLTLRGLGLKPYLAKNIVKYRSKGGKFRKPEDFARIYGLDPQKYEELRPYIKIASSGSNSYTTTAPKMEERAANHWQTTETTSAPHPETSDLQPLKYPPGTQVDITTADTTELKKIPHIGASFAGRIVKYRRLLGGYYCVEQIKEVYGMTPELYQEILPWLKVGEGQINKLPVNDISIERLKSHPYINFYQAKAILDLKRKKGRLQQMGDLSLLEEFSEADFQRLMPYLSF